MPRPHDLIGIGDFARRVRLTPKQLRDYDENGLLAPAYVDADTGYRYYHRGQARTAVTIALLRSLDVPLSAVHDLLVADDVAPLLDVQRARIEAEVERRRRRCARSTACSRVRNCSPTRSSSATSPDCTACTPGVQRRNWSATCRAGSPNWPRTSGRSASPPSRSPGSTRSTSTAC